MNIKEVEPYSQYIGDGIYLIDRGYDGYHYWLITTDGIDIQNKIALDHNTVLVLLHVLRVGLKELHISTVSIHTQAD